MPTPDGAAPAGNSFPQYRCTSWSAAAAGGSTFRRFWRKGLEGGTAGKGPPTLSYRRSLLPLNLPLLERLGVLEQWIPAVMVKPGAEFNYEATSRRSITSTP
jgi:hypothetical protein